MKTKFETLMENQLVGNLGPDDLIIYTRHLFLLSAKEIVKYPELYPEGDVYNSVDVVLSLQNALENFGPNFV